MCHLIHLESLNFDSIHFCTLSTNQPNSDPWKWPKNVFLVILDSPRLIWRKIWMTEKSWNFHIVSWQHWYYCTSFTLITLINQLIGIWKIINKQLLEYVNKSWGWQSLSRICCEFFFFFRFEESLPILFHLYNFYQRKMGWWENSGCLCKRISSTPSRRICKWK